MINTKEYNELLDSIDNLHKEMFTNSVIPNNNILTNSKYGSVIIDNLEDNVEGVEDIKYIQHTVIPCELFNKGNIIELEIIYSDKSFEIPKFNDSKLAFGYHKKLNTIPIEVCCFISVNIPYTKNNFEANIRKIIKEVMSKYKPTTLDVFIREYPKYVGTFQDHYVIYVIAPQLGINFKR